MGRLFGYLLRRARERSQIICQGSEVKALAPPHPALDDVKAQRSSRCHQHQPSMTVARPFRAPSWSINPAWPRRRRYLSGHRESIFSYGRCGSLAHSYPTLPGAVLTSLDGSNYALSFLSHSLANAWSFPWPLPSFFWIRAFRVQSPRGACKNVPCLSCLILFTPIPRSHPP